MPSSPRPKATNPATRSSCTTWTVSSGRVARAKAIGVLREPGATTAWRRPQRTHSSTSVAQAVAFARPTSALMDPTIRGVTSGHMVTAPSIRVDIWSDVVCPWCYIGKRRFERALDELTGEVTVEFVYHAFQLDPTASPGKSQPVADAYARKFGGPERAKAMIERVTSIAADEGLEFRLDRALRANTLLAHRLLWLTEQPGSPSAQAAMKERLLRAYFHDGLDIGDPDVLAGCAAELGFDRDTVGAFLDSSAGTAEVRDDLEQAAELGITAVPTYVVNDQWAIPGAQDTETFVAVLRNVHDRLQVDAAPACEDDICDV